MFKYEIKKVLGNRFVLAFFAVLFVINLVLSWYQASAAAKASDEVFPSEQREAVAAMFERYREDPEGFLENEYQPIVAYINQYNSVYASVYADLWMSGADMSDFQLSDYWDEYDQEKIDSYYDTYKYFTRRLDYADTYKDNIKDVIQRAQSTQKEAALFGMDAESYDYKYQSEIIELYTVNKEIAFDIEYTRGWDSYFSYTGMNLCALLFMLVLVPSLLLDEKQSGTFPVIHTTKRGYIHLILTKLVALLALVGTTVILFSATSLGIYGLKCGGFSSLSNYVQAFSKYNYCPFIIKVGEYLAVSILIKVLVLFAVGVLIMLLSWFIKNHAMTYLASIVLIGANFVVYITEFLNVNHPLRLLNLFAVLDTDVCFTQYYSINLFNHSAPYLVTMLVFWGGILAVSAVVLVTLFCRISGGGHKQRKKTVSFKLPQVAIPCLSRTSFGFEAHKLLIAGKYLILILLVLLIKIGFTEAYMTYQSSVSDEIYQEYMFMLEGEWTQEKAEYIDDERAAIDAILLAETDMEAAYSAGEIGFYDYNDYRKELYDAKVRDNIFARIESQEAYILEAKAQGVEAHFVYATGWNAMYSQTFDFILYGLMLVIVVFIFTMEFQGMLPILRATRKGRSRILVTKYLLAISIAVVLHAVFAYVDYHKMMELYDFTAGGSPAQSLTLLGGLSVSMSLRGFFVLYECVKGVGFVLLAVLAVSVSILVRKAIYSMAITLLLTVVPFVLRYFGFGFAKYLDFTCLLSGSQYLVMSLESALYGCLFILCVLLLTAGMTVWGCIKWNDAH